jgi:site-specific DNA-methyltransferase (adenine-specific)
MKTERLDLRLMDNMELMREFPDKHFDLACIDPPYGLGDKLVAGGTWSVKYQKKGACWDVVPPPEFWTELFRVSKDWIIWGGNYFTQFIPPSRHFIPWVKPNMSGMHTMSNVELALTSFDRNSKTFDLTSQTEHGTERFHVCQKPVALYRWIFANYAKPGMRVLDTHLGSFSSVIAAVENGIHITGCEIDPDYFKAGIDRVNRHLSQQTFPFLETSTLPSHGMTGKHTQDFQEDLPLMDNQTNERV